MAASSWSPRAFRALVALVGLFPLVQACGSRSDTEEYLFDSDGPIGATPGSAGRPGVAGAGGRGPGVAGGPSVGGRAPVAGAGGVSPVAGTAPVAGRPGVGGAGGAGGAGTAGTAGVAGSGSITCGAERCDSGTQSCCLSGGLQCIDQRDACSGPVLGCTTHADCSGDFCCLSITGDVAAASSCKPRCDTQGNGRDRQLCDSDADCRPPFRFCRATVFGLNLCVFRP